MSDISEAEFTPLVEQWLRRWFADGAIDTGPTLSTGRRPDYLVQTPLNTFVVEVENDWNSTANTQTAFYAAHDPDSFTPVTVLPAGHRKPLEYEVMRNMTRMIDGYLVELDPDSLTAQIFPSR